MVMGEPTHKRPGLVQEFEKKTGGRRFKKIRERESRAFGAVARREICNFRRRTN